MGSPLLAKKPANPESPRFEETLLGHSLKVFESFKIIFGFTENQPTRLARHWLRFFKLKDHDFSAFYLNGLFACGLHDLGKGNNDFQDIVCGKSRGQALWHEHLSGLMIILPEIWEWIKKIPLLDERIILSSVIGHHLRADFKEYAQPLSPDKKQFRVFFKEIFKILNDILSNGEYLISNQYGPEAIWSFEDGLGYDLSGLREKVKKELRKFRLELRENANLNNLLMAVRAGLIITDSCGSAIVREKKDINEWLKSAFDGTIDGEYIFKNVIKPRISQIKKTKNSFNWNDFQIAAEGLSNRALLIAPCGSGKTLAAWRWIKARLDNKPKARVIFLYPTRATAKEGFRDYVSWAPEADASLVSGTAAYELQGMFNNPEDQRYGKDFTIEDRLYALGFWHKKIFSATVDQFLGFMQQVYRSVCLIPLLVDSVVVIDEVHSFDRNLFSAFKLFIKNFDIPVLCMTASLTPSRKKELVEECNLEIFPRNIMAFSDLEAKANLPRYLISHLEDKNEAEQTALAAFNNGKKVLWVVNTVSRCQEIARPLNALCYHSRFRLGDRKERHDVIVRAFQPDSQYPALAITTQVCEMSLDLDADILISEIAPITSMIQRMGRCNRHDNPNKNRLGEVVFYQPKDEKPYTQDDMIGVNEFLEELEGKKVTQLFLESLLEKYGPAETEIERYSAFIENGPWALAREQSLRDESDYTVNAILSGDIRIYFELLKYRKPTDGLFVPVPRQFVKSHTRLGQFPQVADSSHYHPKYGFFDHPLEEII